MGHTLGITKEYYAGVHNAKYNWKGSDVAVIGCCPNAECKLLRVSSSKDLIFGESIFSERAAQAKNIIVYLYYRSNISP